MNWNNIEAGGLSKVPIWSKRKVFMQMDQTPGRRLALWPNEYVFCGVAEWILLKCIFPFNLFPFWMACGAGSNMTEKEEMQQHAGADWWYSRFMTTRIRTDVFVFNKKMKEEKSLCLVNLHLNSPVTTWPGITSKSHMTCNLPAY